MKITFLGSQGSLQSKESGNVSLLVDDGCLILIDVNGAPAQSICLAGYDPLSIDMVVLTHYHVDHIYGLPSLLHNLWLLKRTSPLRIVANGETLDKARRLCDIFGLQEKPGMFPIDWEEWTGRPFDVQGNLRVALFDVEHGVPTCGVICTDGVSRFVYTSDTRPFSEFPPEMFDADLLVHEAGGVEADEPDLYKGGHCSGRQAAHTADETHAKRLVLCHLPLSEVAQRSILKEASDLFPDTELPILFVPYDI